MSELRSPTQWLTHTLVIASLLGLSVAVCKYLLSPSDGEVSSRKLPLPPGPKDKWYYPGARAPIRYAKMMEIYGPVFSFRQGKNIFVVIGGYQAAVDIMQKHGADLVDRPRLIAAGDIVSGGMRTLLTPAGERLKRLRRALHSQLQPSAVSQWLPLQTKNAKALVLDILHEPDKHIDHARRFAASLIMTMTYGKTSPTYYSDPEVLEISRNSSRLGTVTQIGASSHVVDVYPVLRYIPWFTAKLRSWHRDELDLFTRQVNAVRKQLASNNAQPSFVTYLLDHQAEYGLSDDETAYLAGSMFGAGSETTASAISFVIMAAAVFPDEQAKVQAELDSVVGRERVPTAEDEAVLPRVVAFYLECFRWRPTSWGGFAHRATKDVFWNNYTIPAGAIVIGNHWAIGLDPDVYPEPAKFTPDRWLDEGGRTREELSFFTYGFGRRVCPGQHLADNSLFLATAFILWAFRISQDPSHPIDTMGFSDAQNTRPNPFVVKFEPRIGNIEEVIGDTMS
ncbi:cytochrome P450 [Cytidiella melzeri]|nr:cytochrome P450 [Cytidiella melzeri]